MVIRDQKIDRLIVAGCSFSDYANVEKNYSEYLAEKLGIEHVPGYTSGLGSNDRIFRTLLTGIREKKITKSDFLVIQYTELLRKEFWSLFTRPLVRGGNKSKGSYNREPYLDGQIIKYKLDAYTWHDIKEEKQLFSLLTNYFTCLEFEEEKFKNFHYTLLNTLEKHEINTIFLETGYTSNTVIDLYDCIYCTKLKVNPPLGPFNSKDYLEYCLTKDDCTHLNSTGHEKLSEFLYDHIKNTVILNKTPEKVIHYGKTRQG